LVGNGNTPELVPQAIFIPDAHLYMQEWIPRNKLPPYGIYSSPFSFYCN